MRCDFVNPGARQVLLVAPTTGDYEQVEQYTLEYDVVVLPMKAGMWRSHIFYMWMMP